jgi:predicted ester cyclase
MSIDIATLRDFGARYATAWCSQNPARVAEFYSPNGSLTVNDSAPAIGREPIREVARAFMKAFPDLQVRMDELVIQNGKPEFHWTLIGTNDGPGGKGQRVRISGYEIWQMGDDGLIASSQGHFDEAEYQRQIQSGM